MPPATIPHGVADHFWTAAADRRQLGDDLLALFRGWGYGDVMLPAFEYVDTLERRSNEAFRSELYRFMDRDGSTLALRADMTIAVARLVATRLHDVPLPQRFCYVDSVFRYTKEQGGRQREFFQAGVELVGSPSPAADAEVLAIAAHAMTVARLPSTRIAVGHLGYFHGLLDALQLSAEGQSTLISAIDRNTDAELTAFLQQTSLEANARATVSAIPHLTGGNPQQLLERARSHALNQAMVNAVDNLQSILDALAAHHLPNPLILDLTEIHNLGYYTGITFEVLAPGLGFAVASGGRYDNLVGTFGAPQPAVGAAFVLDRLLSARRTDSGFTAPQPVVADLLLAPDPEGVLLEAAERWRMLGVRIALEVDGRTGDALAAKAQEEAIPAAIEVADGEVVLHLADQAARQRLHKEILAFVDAMGGRSDA